MIRITPYLFMLSLLMASLSIGTPTQAQQEDPTQNTQPIRPRYTYLAMIQNGKRSELPLMSGVYPLGWPSDSTINNEMKPLDNWLAGINGGRSTSIYGTFLTLNLTGPIAKSNVEDPLTVIWNAGYTPFVNLPAIAGHTAESVADGIEDSMIKIWASSYKNYANNGSRFAYIAPMQEMNGEWVTYGGDPIHFKEAYKRIQNIFAQQGVPARSVKWVFAPNAWTKPGMPLFEAYYPGDAFVDVVAISAYNFGYCRGGEWEEPEIVFNNPTFTNGHYLDRMRLMAPSKPIFIAQTATSSWRSRGSQNAAEKERWLRDAYSYLAKQLQVRAVIYFNQNKECDWAIFASGIQNPGYKDGINKNGYIYISPAKLMITDHTYH